MGIFGIKSRDQKEKETVIMSLIHVMMADGVIDEREQEFLYSACEKRGITPEQLGKMLKNPEKVKFVVPSKADDAFEMLLDTIMMMLSDGEIDQEEMDLCVSMAVALGFRPSSVEDLIRKIIASFQEGQSEMRLSIEDYV